MSRLSLRARVTVLAGGIGVLAAALVGVAAAGASADAAPVITVAVIAAALSAAAAWVFAGRVTESVQRLALASRRVADGDFNARAGAGGPPEIAAAADAVSRLSERLKSLLEIEGSGRMRLSSILDTMTDGVLVVDEDGLVELANPAALAMLDAPSGFRAGDRLVTLNRDREVLRVVTECARDRTPHRGQAELLGSRRFLNIVAVPLTGEAGLDEPARGRGRALVLLNDLTEMRRVEVTRSEFVSNASHELRTPLAAIRASAETLQMGALNDPEAASGFLQRIGDNVVRLDQMIAGMMELSRLETGAAPMHLAPTDLRQVVLQEVDRLRPVAEQAGVRVETSAPDDLPAVTADRDMACQVVSNLLANALGATSSGDTVRVDIRRSPDGVALAVQDDGRGIEPEHLPHVFERFFKADPARSSPGSGLGLAIVKHIAQAHGADVSVESTPGDGSTFTVTFPLTRGFEPGPTNSSA